jgi:hypothetical protein
METARPLKYPKSVSRAKDLRDAKTDRVAPAAVHHVVAEAADGSD